MSGLRRSHVVDQEGGIGFGSSVFIPAAGGQPDQEGSATISSVGHLYGNTEEQYRELILGRQQRIDKALRNLVKLQRRSFLLTKLAD